MVNTALISKMRCLLVFTFVFGNCTQRVRPTGAATVMKGREATELIQRKPEEQKYSFHTVQKRLHTNHETKTFFFFPISDPHR